MNSSLLSRHDQKRRWACSAGGLMIGLLLLAGNPCTGAPRDRLLLDAGWRFQLGDPADVLANSAETNVTYYPEISNLEKLTTGEISGPGSETNLAKLRPDPVTTRLGENVPAVQSAFDDSGWQPVNLPHDWVVSLPFDSGADMGHGYKSMISGTNSPTTVGWYRHTFTVPAADTNRTLWLEFDGVYRNCLVWLNGHVLGRHVSGYTGFLFDISRYANPGGTNVLVVRVDASRFEGWFYEGAGIYRHVWLVKTSPVHVAHWGTYVTNQVTGSNASITIQTQVSNDGSNAAPCGLASLVCDPDGNLVANAVQTITVAAQANLLVTQTVTITNARLWSLNSPLLYTLSSVVTQGSVTNDAEQTSFGIRTIQWDASQGLLLNGRRVELQGMCNHQDAAGVGIAVPDRVQYYRVERLKEMGCNAWRTAHNPPAPALLEACDRLGMLVLDENRRVGVDPETLGEVQSLVLRDRNHPCVFAWSLGNEEVYVQGSATGAGIMQTMQNLANQIDPTRLCTVAQNGSWGSGFTTVIEVQGYNYRVWGNEDAVHAGFPNLPSMSTEEGSTEAARGIYSDTSVYKANYDNEPTHSYTIEQLWQFYSARPWQAGLCIWTGLDYRGEPTPFSWPNINSQYGPLDTCGFAKDIFYYYQANWTPKPVLHILPHWNWPTAGQPVNVWVYSDCDLVELFLNGVSKGRQTNNVAGHLAWSLPYAAGTLQAVGYLNGQAVLTNGVTTTGAPAGLTLQPDRKTVAADGQDVSLVTVAVVDSQGRVVPTATNGVSFTIAGGAIIGLGNGDPADHESDQATNNIGWRSVFSGLAQVIVQSTNPAGSITLTATAAGLPPTSVIIGVVPNPIPPTAPSVPMAIGSGGQVWMSWEVVPGAMTYNLKRATASGGPYSIIAGNTAALGVVDTNVINGTTYYYVLSAINPNGEGSNSVEVSAVPHIVPPLFISQPASFTNGHPVYAGAEVSFSALAFGDPPINYQWYEIIDGVTNQISGGTNATFSFLCQSTDTNSVVGYFVVAGNGGSNVSSVVANLYNTPGPPGVIKANTAGMNGAADWSPALIPGGSYIGSFDDTISSANEAALSLDGNLTLAGLLFLYDLNGPVNLSGEGVLTLDCSGLSGWPGIDMSVANQSVTLNCAVVLKGAQAWNVTPGRTLAIGGPLTTTGAGVDFTGFAGTPGLLANTNGILGPWAAIGTGTGLSYATVGGGSVAPYAGGTIATPNNMADPGVNYIATNALAVTANSSGNTLQYVGNLQTISLGTSSLSLNGLMNSGTGTLTLSGTNFLNIGAIGELVVVNNSQGIVLSCPVGDNPDGSARLTYNGGGGLTLNPNASSTGSDNASTFTGDLVINGGTVSVQKSVNVSAAGPAASSALGSRSVRRNVVVNGGATLSFDAGNELGRGAGDSGAGNQVFPLMTIIVNPGGTVKSTTSNRTIGPLVLNGGTLNLNNVNTTAYEPFGLSADVTVAGNQPSFINGVLGGGINLTANAGANSQRTFTVADVTGGAGLDLTVSAILANSAGNSSAAGLIKAGNGTMALTAANIYTGPTTINGGTLLVDGALAAGSMTVNNGGTLGGSGTIGGAVTVAAGGTLLAGDGGTNTSTLTIGNSLTLAGNAIVVLNRGEAQTAGHIAGVTTLNRGGTLTVTNAGAALQSGDTFVLFNAASYSGSFAATNLPALLPGLSWSNRITGGTFTLAVIGQVKTPTIGTACQSSGNIVFSGNNGVPSSSYRVLSATNLAAPVEDWTPVATNVFAADGGYTNRLLMDAIRGSRFYRIVVP